MGDEIPGPEEVRSHLRRRYMPTGYEPVVTEVLGLIHASGWKIGDDLVTVPAGLSPIEAALPAGDGSQLVRVVDLVKALDLLELLPERLSWVGRHPSWGSR